MGIGDNIMATAMARGASLRSKRIAFGDGYRIHWDQYSELIFRGNPNVAPPGTETTGGLEWIPFYKGHRIYNKQSTGKWIWNYDFKVKPGELFLTKSEKTFAELCGKNFVLIEPCVPSWKSVAPNKQWPVFRYAEVATKLQRQGFDVVQLVHRGTTFKLPSARYVVTPNFRLGAAVLARSSLYIGSEGGLHHAAAAMNVPGVVLFGGFIPPEVTGYDSHINLTGGREACGSLQKCDHCIEAMNAISVDEVLSSAITRMSA